MTATATATVSSSLTGDGEGLLGLFLRLRGFGIHDDDLFRALESVPYSHFISPFHVGGSWIDESFPLSCGQIVWSADVYARMIFSASLKSGDTVLEVGSGSGYLTALSSFLVRKVRSVERYGKLVDEARLRLAHLGIRNVSFDHMDGYFGTPGEGLYDCILCDSCYDVVPDFLVDQLVSGGVIITAMGLRYESQMLVRFRLVDGCLEREDLFPVRFTYLERGSSKFF